LGFSVAWRFPEGTSEEQVDKTVDDFINDVIEPNKLAFDGSGYHNRKESSGTERNVENKVSLSYRITDFGVRGANIRKSEYERDN
ncbi:50S ribosome-binding protein YggL, partial [Salmonella enterica subsp. enterica serovar Anatum]|nr:50S ribosome-binding protein YggL [Salmonella enterica subsp. enterica serovar Anatum]